MGSPCSCPVRLVLVVDDDPGVRAVCVALLEGWGFATLQAVDGIEALDTLAGSHVDAMLLDINMPRLCGDQVLARLRRTHERLPVIIMSSEDHSTRRQVLGLGANAFLAKPFAPSSLRMELDKALA